MRQPEERQRLGQKVLGVVALMLVLTSHHTVSAQPRDMMVRISEIQIHATYLDAYTAILKEEAEASVRLEPGVIAIFPMYQREHPTEFRILEVYASRDAYESHLKTPHFQKYKSTTLQMVKSLKLVDMQTVDAATMTSMFGKLRGVR
jgi:quinol monooxygenase YgiN